MKATVPALERVAKAIQDYSLLAFIVLASLVVCWQYGAMAVMGWAVVWSLAWVSTRP